MITFHLPVPVLMVPSSEPDELYLLTLSAPVRRPPCTVLLVTSGGCESAGNNHYYGLCDGG